jgi:2'-5' RNA ligase
MEPIPALMPGYRVNDYQIVLAPHEELWTRIYKLRKEFAEQYQLPFARGQRPHITTVRFSQWEMMEDRILQRLQTIAMGITPFKIELKDYGSFPSHSIFINVLSRLPVQQVVTELKEMQRLLRMNQEHKPHFIDEPYILLAQRLKPWQYEQAWLDYRHRQFTGRFIADQLLLLKRPTDSRSSWQVAGRFRFENLPVSTRQGNLFF